MQVGNADPSRWTLTITDAGIGIEQQDLACVFDPFWRGKSAKQYAQEGNGLGLTIVREFIRLMKGVIDVQSRAGKGTTVKITLPNSIPPIGAQDMKD
jgi:signal transduction histidine kinase